MTTLEDKDEDDNVRRQADNYSMDKTSKTPKYLLEAPSACGVYLAVVNNFIIDARREQTG